MVDVADIQLDRELRMKGRHSDRNDISVKHYKSFYEAAKQLPTDIERLAVYVGIDE